MTNRPVNLVKLCVGVSSVAELSRFQQRRLADARSRGETYLPSHVTRMHPRRRDELLAGGSLYWVIKGLIQVRQVILDLEPVIDDDGIRRCRIVMDAKLIRTVSAPRRPFQGWRYLEAEDSPADLRAGHGDELPEELERKLADIGII